jgi:glycerophosphoryl diester phosphodiesterase
VLTSACLRIGHGGASALAPANTLASFDAAARVGVDMVEFDVREYRGELVLAHTIFHQRRAGNPRLHDALAHLSQPQFDRIELNVDVKRTGFEPRLLAELSQAGLVERTIVSSQIPLVLDRLRELEPRLRLGMSVGGRVARTFHSWRDWRSVALGGLAARRWDVVMVQYRLIDARLLDQVAERTGRLFAWTVNERLAIQRLTGLGVHGITTADPRLFV